MERLQDMHPAWLRSLGLREFLLHGKALPTRGRCARLVIRFWLRPTYRRAFCKLGNAMRKEVCTAKIQLLPQRIRGILSVNRNDGFSYDVTSVEAIVHKMHGNARIALAVVDFPDPRGLPAVFRHPALV